MRKKSPTKFKGGKKGMGRKKDRRAKRTMANRGKNLQLHNYLLECHLEL